ncbi:MAG: hypothetical protein PVH35_04015, partial [Syntrophobacterales bacterium]
KKRLLNRRRPQTTADLKTLHCVYSNDRSKVERGSPAVTDKRAYLCLRGLPIYADVIHRRPAPAGASKRSWHRFEYFSYPIHPMNPVTKTIFFWIPHIHRRRIPG